MEPELHRWENPGWAWKNVSDEMIDMRDEDSSLLVY
jgi:hypothetical protein